MSAEQVPAPGPERPEAPQRSFWVVGAVLLAAVVLVLAGALLLSRVLRPNVGLEPVATGSAGATAVSQPEVTQPAAFPAGAATAGGSTEQAVERAYLRYWEVYSAALSTLDASRLPDVMAGTELADARRQLEDLRAQGRTARTDVEHDYTVVLLAADRATVRDRYRNRSYMVDARTGQPVQAPGEGSVTEIAAELEMEGGAWKVTRIVQLV
jgi:hypothetical protein